MGNCFGKQSSSADDDNFAGAGRTIGAAPQPQGPDANARGTIPARISQGRTLGGGDAVDEEDPRTAAARAAEERASKAQGKGALGKKLDAQRQQTRTNTLEQASRENRLARDADAAAQTRNWD
ncbi:MAG: hypothetical protein M1821_003425 [Bathelium mastoideum]|nr:MAG: hypothetical protein M1821_003425 [Bathelium mastoideum]